MFTLHWYKLIRQRYFSFQFFDFHFIQTETELCHFPPLCLPPPPPTYHPSNPSHITLYSYMHRQTDRQIQLLFFPNYMSMGRSGCVHVSVGACRGLKHGTPLELEFRWLEAPSVHGELGLGSPQQQPPSSSARVASELLEPDAS